MSHGNKEFDSQTLSNRIRGHLYFSKGTAKGQGRDGIVSSNGCDHPLEFQMSRPKSIGGKSMGTNPEQLLAMAYASSFLEALHKSATRLDKKSLADDVKVHAYVYLGLPVDTALEGHTLKVELNVEGLSDDDVIGNAHENCTFSRALRDVDVVIKKC